MAFVKFCVCDPKYSVAFLERAISNLFEIMPQVICVAYFLPETLILFPPFSSPRPTTAESEKLSEKRQWHANSGKFFNEVPLINQAMTHNLQVCRKRDFCPPFMIRLARVEDCDDLVPLFTKHNVKTIN